jgi:hypothetical protein
MTRPGPYRGAFAHQHGDPRSLRERIEEAVEMAGLALMVDLRRLHGRPAPEPSSAADRKEFEETAAALLAHLGAAFQAELPAQQRAGVARAEAGTRGEHERLLAGQVFLARHLPDYWQRFEVHRAAYVRTCLDAPPGG